MKPILYCDTETAFSSNGIGVLYDAISCKVTEELNGQYELTMKYPLTGIHAEFIADRCLILAKSDPVAEAQPFRVYNIRPSSDGTIVINARHLAYDTMGIPVAPFSALSAADAMVSVKAATVVDCPFDFYTDKTTSATLNARIPKSLWRTLGGSAGSILDVYGGEYEFDRYDIQLHNRRGADRGVSIRYGKNLSTLEQDRNCAECYTGVYPYWASADGETLVQLPEKVIAADGTYNYVKILTLDLSAEWQEEPTVDQVRTRAERYMTDNDIGVPTVSWQVEFVQLEQTEEYKGTGLLERVLLGDTVTVVFPVMHVNASARAVKTVYDCLLERYESVTLGKVKSNLADTIARQQQEIEKKPSATVMQSIAAKLADSITGAKGGAVRLLDTDGDGLPDELYIADDPDPNSAVEVWRFNYKGWAASANGYNGPWEFGATLKDGLLAKFITAANLVAGTIRSADGTSFLLDLDNGIMNMSAGTIQSANGKIVIDLTGATAIPVFNTGISTNGLIVRADEAGAPELLTLRAAQIGDGGYIGVLKLTGIEGNALARICEDYTADNERTGARFDLYSRDDSTAIITRVVDGRASIDMMTTDSEGAVHTKVRLSADEEYGYLNTNYINARKISWKSNGDGTYTLIGE